MFVIKNKQILANDIKRIDVHAPHIAKKIQPGQFVSVCPQEGDERIPLTVVEADQIKGTIALIFQEIGETTKHFGAIPINESVFSILGPLGTPAKIEKKGTVVCIATGIGAAQILPICRAFRKAGNKVIGIVGAKTKRTLLLEAQMRLSCNKIFITTNDGSWERRGVVTDALKDMIQKQEVDLVYAIGSAEMMQAVCLLTQTKNIPTRVALNPMMVDCMGMCGSCRVKIGEEILLACVDGPEFDGHKVDFNHFNIRVNAFKGIEEWHNRSSQPNPKNDEPKTFRKFLSGILRE